MVEMSTAIRGKLPPVTRVIGLDTEAEFLYVTTATKDTTAKKKDAHAKKDTSVARPKSDVLALDLGSARVDTVASGIEQATLGPDGTLYTVDAKRRVVTLARRVRVAWPQPLPGVPLQLFGAADQRLVVADPPALITAAADQPPTSRPLPAGSDVAATRWGDLVAWPPTQGSSSWIRSAVARPPSSRSPTIRARWCSRRRAIAFTSPDARSPAWRRSTATTTRRSTASLSRCPRQPSGSTRSDAGCWPSRRRKTRYSSWTSR